MNYSEFKDYLVTFLWKVGDAALIANLDNLIKMADAELNRKLTLQDRDVVANLTATGVAVDLPIDYYKMRTVTADGVECRYANPGELSDIWTGFDGQFFPVYSLRGTSTLLVCGPWTTTNTMPYQVQYQSKIPDFAATDSSWLADQYLDLYSYTILKHSAPFLREDERIAVWSAMALDALESALETDAHNRARGTAKSLRLPVKASSTRGSRR